MHAQKISCISADNLYVLTNDLDFHSEWMTTLDASLLHRALRVQQDHKVPLRHAQINKQRFQQVDQNAIIAPILGIPNALCQLRLMKIVS